MLHQVGAVLEAAYAPRHNGITDRVATHQDPGHQTSRKALR